MDDDFFEEDDEGIFGEDETFDYMVLDELEKKDSSIKNSGCLSSVLLTIATIGGSIICIALATFCE